MPENTSIILPQNLPSGVKQSSNRRVVIGENLVRGVGFFNALAAKMNEKRPVGNVDRLADSLRDAAQ
jgi:hypothetical protein